MSRSNPALIVYCDHPECTKFVELDLGALSPLEVSPTDRLGGRSWWTTADVDRESEALGWYESEDRGEALCPKHAKAHLEYGSGNERGYLPLVGP